MNEARERWKWKKELLALVMVVLASTLPYLNSLPNDFVWDDRPLIIEDYHLRSPKFLDDIFLRDFFSHSDEVIKYGYYRPVITLSYLLDLALWGLKPFGFHITNILFHLLCGILVYLVARMLFPALPLVSLIAALLFAVHPIHTESVTWIAGRTDVICTFFFLTALYFHLINNPPASYHLLLALFSFALALLAKEMALTLPVIIFLYEYLGRSKKFGASLRQSLPYLGILFLYLIWRYLVLRINVTKPLNILEEGIYLLSLLKTFWLYMYKLIWPAHLSAYIQNPFVKDLFGIPAGLTILLSVGLATLIWKAHQKRSWLCFLLGAFLFSFLPLSNLIAISAPADMGFPMSERFLYLPSIFFVIIVARLLKNYLRSPILLLTLTLCLLAVMGSRTILRNREWRNEGNFFKICLKDSPHAPLLHANLGVYYSRVGKNQEAITSLKEANEYSRRLGASNNHALLNNLSVAYRMAGNYDEAIAILNQIKKEGPVKASYEYNLGECFQKQGKVSEAEQAFLRALSLNPYYVEALTALGRTYQEMGKPEDAIRSFHQALSLFPDSADLHLALGVLYKQGGQYREAIKEYQMALRINPDLAAARGNMGVVYALLKDFSQARTLLEEAVAHDPFLWDAQNALGMVYAMQNDLAAARKKFREILKANPDNVEAILNEGILFYQEGRLEMARSCFERVLAIDPHHARARAFLVQLDEPPKP